VNKDRKEMLVNKDHRVNRVIKDQVDHKDQQVLRQLYQDHKVNKENKDRKDHKVNKVIKDRKDHKDQLVPVYKDQLGHKDQAGMVD